MSDRRLILIIDDEPTIVRGLQLRLERAGFDIISVYNGQAGARLAIERIPAAVILDSQMPGLDGFGALALMKQDARTNAVPVIMASGQDSGREEALAGGAAAFLIKPFDGRELIKLIDELTLASCASSSDRI